MKEFMDYDFNVKKIIIACFVPAGTGSITHKNRSSHGLAIHKSGDKVYTFSDGKKLRVQDNDIIYLPKYSNYVVTPIVHGDCYAINFDIDEDIVFEPFVTKAKKHNEIIEYFRSATKVWSLKRSAYTMKCKAELYNIIYAIKQEYYTEYLPRDKYAVIQPAVDYIHSKYTKENISIESLSKMCNITPEYFRKIFKIFHGVSPVKYINNLKISSAKELLESQMYSVSEAALQSGYNEMSHFSREFKKQTGISPSDYKKIPKADKELTR